MHLHKDSPRYIMKEGAWATPFGELQVDEALAGKLMEKFAFNVETPEYCSSDNTIELQLPFVKYFFKDVKILPVGVPPSEKSLAVGETVVEIAAELGRQIIVLGSTDLTHYGWNYVPVLPGHHTLLCGGVVPAARRADIATPAQSRHRRGARHEPRTGSSGPWGYRS